MKTNIDSILEGQKKVLDVWSETTRNMADAFAGGIPKEMPNDYISKWVDSQKKYWDAILNNGNLENAFERAPEDMRKWAEVQTEYAKKWMDFYTENAGKYGFRNAPFDQLLKSANPSSDPWQQWMNQNSEWIQKNVLKNLPFSQQFQLKNYKDLYETFSHYWEYLSKMIEFGMTEWDAIGRFITPETYREIVGKFMGYKPAHNAEELIKQTNEVFEKYIDAFKQYGVQKDWPNNWLKMSRAYTEGHPAEAYKSMLEISHNVKQGIDKFYNLAGQGKEVEISRILKDIQFTYVAFIIKSLELQTKVFEISQPVLSKTIEVFNKEYQTSKSIPDFQLFFNQYVNNLESALIDLMEGKEYAILQGELSKLAATLKGKMDKIFELSLEGTPFLMKSFSDEVAKETAALRKRIRDLELRLSQFDHPVQKNPVQKKGRTAAAKK